MNLLTLVPAFKRHLNQYKRSDDTDSKLAAYLADGIEALAFRWSRTYEITIIEPESYFVEPTVEARDKRAIILMASIIYKMGNVMFAGFKDGDFMYDPQQGRQNPLQVDIEELARFLPIYKLAKAKSAPLRGYNSFVNPESYMFWLEGVVGGSK